MQIMIKVARSCLFIASFFLLPPPCHAAGHPKLPYVDQGACPFECCTYRDWNTTRAVEIHIEPARKARRAFEIPAGETVHALTGMVITTKTGVTLIHQPVQIGYDKAGHGPLLSLQAGERVYTLHYQGEGFDLFWYKGKVYSDQISVENSTAVQTESRPQTGWWAEIRDKQGRTGWAEVADNFDHIDACE